ncbi:hypothetical protein RJT34_04678 [Clitoria ternatea]|uniref:RING-type domain-containing protein n=1 Tax=Clitoria ternatea TaxID=43366 RepID=A0AAN9KMI8_CLITE
MVSERGNNDFIDLQVFDLDEALAVAAESRRPTGAWKTFVSKLPTVNDVTEEDVCSVCREGQREGENKRVPCGHVYHSNCITLWLEHCNSCPLCRQQIISRNSF